MRDDRLADQACCVEPRGIAAIAGGGERAGDVTAVARLKHAGFRVACVASRDLLGAPLDRSDRSRTHAPPRRSGARHDPSRLRRAGELPRGVRVHRREAVPRMAPRPRIDRSSAWSCSLPRPARRRRATRFQPRWRARHAHRASCRRRRPSRRRSGRRGALLRSTRRSSRYRCACRRCVRSRS